MNIKPVLFKKPRYFLLLLLVLLGIANILSACDIQINTNNCGTDCSGQSASSSNTTGSGGSSLGGNGNATGGNTSSGITSQPSSGHSPIAEGDFLNSSGPVAGPAIIEFWNGQGGTDKVCGTFQLPSGESFSYSPAGHWWKYKSDQDMQAEWSLHLKLFYKKSENASCTNGQRPPA